MWDFEVNVWSSLIAIMGSGFVAYLLSKLVVGKKVDVVEKKADKLLSFYEEEDRQKTKQAIADLNWVKYQMEREGTGKEIDMEIHIKIWTVRSKYDDYLNLQDPNEIIVHSGSEIRRRADMALSLIGKHGYNEGKKYMREELKKLRNKS